ncbi:unnamed protein product [Linum tenue]|uniref:RNA helicase n=1 Tax=Linum tenue TaxID=586396 RepID=A0AAV0JUC4_9ROSI|nr:unnamed protein product [Linum tenue]
MVELWVSSCHNGSVHEEVRGSCFAETDNMGMEYIKPRLDQVKVVAVTCLGITSSLLTGKKFDVCIMDEAGQITLMALNPDRAVVFINTDMHAA